MPRRPSRVPSPWLRHQLPLTLLSLLLLTSLGLALDHGSVAAHARRGHHQSTADATIAETEFTVPEGNAPGEASVSCPRGTRVTGGGVLSAASATFDDRRDSWVVASGPLDASGDPAQTNDGGIATQWYAAVHNANDASPQQTYRVFALCSARSDATIAEQEFPVTANSLNAVSAPCPPGRRVLGGGVQPTGPVAATFAQVRASGPLDGSGDPLQTKNGDKATQWYAGVASFGGVATTTWRVFALCSANTKATIKETQFTPPVPNFVQAAVSCGRKRRSVGGGVAQSGDLGTLDNGNTVVDSGPLDATGVMQQTNDGTIATQWSAAIWGNDLQVRTYRVFALCA